MVTKTELCHFSEFKVYPGRGHRFVRKDGRTFFFLSKKTRSLHFQKVKTSDLTWTPMWRRKNRKGAYAKATRVRTKRTTRKMKAVVGMSLAEINRIRNQGAKERDEMRSKIKDDQKKKRTKQIESRKAAQKGHKGKKDKNQFAKQSKGGKARRAGF